MPAEAEDVLADISRQVEALAMGIALSGDSPGAGSGDQAASLLRIQERAKEAHLPGVEEAATQLLRTVQGDAVSPQSLNEGIARLHEAVAPKPAAKPASNSFAQDPELIQDFIQEAREHLTTIEIQVLALEQNPSHAEAIHSAFRCFHTIKGLAGFLELDAVRACAHDIESLLDQARNGKLAITPAVIDVVLAGKDYLGQATAEVERCQKDGSARRFADFTELRGRIQAVITGVAPPPPAPKAAETEPAPAAPQPPQIEKFSVRVDAIKLDYLVDMVGELVIAQAMLRRDTELAEIGGLRVQRNLTHLSRVTSEVQKCTMSMRIVRIAQLFQRTLRVVRDLSRRAGKQIEVVLSGEDTELDKTIIEALADPLLHMVRNSIDHGIEPPEERQAAGKNPTGRISLRACHQGGYILVEVTDDGRGLDCQKIRAKAIQRELIAADAQLTNTELYNLIFEAGLSTAEKVTDISGRGVGMDVVRRQIQKLRGSVDIDSEIGKGTTFHMRLPFTLAIIEGLVVGVGSERYLVPISAVQEMVRPTQDSICSVEGRHEMAMVRDQLLPIVRLHRRFGITPRTMDPCAGLLIVVESEGKRFCLLVDEFIGKQEIVIKSLGETLKDISGIAGGAILGDGRVGLILDFGRRLPGAPPCLTRWPMSVP